MKTLSRKKKQQDRVIIIEVSTTKFSVQNLYQNTLKMSHSVCGESLSSGFRKIQ